nr:unnamed protein product [Callosobruchus chinensis]
MEHHHITTDNLIARPRSCLLNTYWDFSTLGSITTVKGISTPPLRSRRIMPVTATLIFIQACLWFRFGFVSPIYGTTKKVQEH